jgi:hypothetical protein
MSSKQNKQKTSNDDIQFKYIVECLHSVYNLAIKKKLNNIPTTFKEFINIQIDKNLCPKQCQKFLKNI